MKKVIIKEINEFNYKLIDEINKQEYLKNLEFLGSYIPKVNDIIYIPDEILKEINLFTFREITKLDEVKESELIKIVSDKEYYLKRMYG
ncbi:MAG: hypothetical protein IJ501_00695 [Bacilli bacterium]|nr:hypothetical protein [Bacilli bacterium]